MQVNGVVSPGSVKKVLQVLDQGEVVGFFPEGEQYIFKNDFSAPIGSFHNGFSFIASKMQVPVLPIVICPIKEEIVDIKIPPQIREDIGKYHDLSKIRKMVKYKKVKVVIGKAIQVKTEEDKGHKAAAVELLSKVHEAMLQIESKYREV